MSTLTTKPKLREVGKATFTYVRPLRETDGVTLDKKNRLAKVVIISEGLGNLRDRNYYSREAVESCPNVFNGRQFYIDHPSESEESDRPERSVRDLAGFFFECEIGRVKDPNTGDILPACFGKLRFANSEPGRLAMEQVAMALEYQKQFPESKDVYAGISINGGGVSHPATVRGMEVNMVTAIEEAFSADIVTKPARGGRFVALMREAAQAAEHWRKVRMHRDAQPARVGSKEAAMATVVKKQPKKEAQKDKPKGVVKEPKGAKEADKPKAGIDPKATQLFESIKERLGKKMQEDGGDGAAVLIDDIKSDLDQLGELLGAGSVAGDEPLPEAEGEGEAEGEAEGEGEDEGVLDDEMGDEDPDAEDDLGMSDEGEGEGEHDGMPGDEKKPGGQLMRYSCGKCGEANEVAPPKGMQLTKMGESTRGGGESEAVRQLERRLAAKEVRFVEANQKHVKTQETLVRENRVLKSRLGAITRLAEARTLIKEAGVAIDMQAKELLAFPKEQWAPMIEREVRRVKREAEMFGTGAVPRGGNITVKEADGKEAISTFRGSYDKDQTQS